MQSIIIDNGLIRDIGKTPATDILQEYKKSNVAHVFADGKLYAFEYDGKK